MMMMFTPERHLPTPGQREHSPQRHTAAGTAAPTTTDTGNTVPQRANPTQTAYAHPRRRAQAQGQARRHVDAGPSTKRADARGTRLHCASESVAVSAARHAPQCLYPYLYLDPSLCLSLYVKIFAYTAPPDPPPSSPLAEPRGVSPPLSPPISIYLSIYLSIYIHIYLNIYISACLAVNNIIGLTRL